MSRYLLLVLLTIGLTAPPAVAQQLSVNTHALSFTKGISSTPLPLTATITVTNSGTAAVTGVGTSTVRYTAGQPSGWLSVGTITPSNLAPGQSVPLTISTQTTGVAGTFTAAFDIGSNNGGIQTVTVTLNVMDAGLTSSTTTFSLSSTAGAPAPSGTFTVFNNGGVTATGVSVSAPTYTPGQPTGWLNVSMPSQSISSGSNRNGSFTTSPQSLPAGYYTATFVVSASNANSVTFTVTLAVNSAGPRISVSVSSLTFNAVAGGSDPAPQSFIVTNAGGGRLTDVTGSVIYPFGVGSWLSSFGQDSTTAPLQMTIYPRTGTLAAGTYSATLLVYSRTAGITDTARIAVTFNVTSAATPAAVASVSVQLTNSTLRSGETTQANVTLRDSNGNALIGRAITYASSNTSVATVSSSGLVTAVAPGNTSIAASSEGRSGSASLSVTAPPANPVIVLSVPSVTISASQNTPVAAQSVAITNGGGGTLALAIGNVSYAAGQPSNWLSTELSASAAPAVITLRPNANGLSAGTYTATVPVSSNTAGVSNSQTILTVSLVVSASAVANVTVTLGSATLAPGAQTNASVVLRDANGLEVSRDVTFTSSNTNIATVNNVGTVTAVAAGSATIMATSEGRSGSATLTVQLEPVASVAVTIDKSTLAVGEQAQATVALQDAAGASLTGRSVAWSTSNNSLATVTSSGRITATGVGTVVISATSEGRTGAATLTIAQPSAVIVLDRSVISISAPAFGSATASLNVTNGGSSQLIGLTATVAPVAPNTTIPTWLTARVTTSVAPATIELTADASRLAPGTYRAQVTVSATGAPNVTANTAIVTAVISEPTTPAVVKDLVAALAGSATLSLEIRQYLDQRGNNNGLFDVGDVLAYLERIGSVGKKVKR